MIGACVLRSFHSAYVAAAFPFAMPTRSGSVLVIDPITLLLGASGLLLVGLVAKPYRAGQYG